MYSWCIEQTPHIKPQTHKQRWTETQQPLWNGQKENCCGEFGDGELGLDQFKKKNKNNNLRFSSVNDNIYRFWFIVDDIVVFGVVTQH